MDLVFRPARPEDKPRVQEITAHTWDDGDYIPEVWDNWLADPQGELAVAVDDDVVVALSKLTQVVGDQWWIEGLRVDPERRLRGIGQAMVAYQVARAKRFGGRVLRYATGIRNEGSHRIAERTGFYVLTRFVERVADKLDSSVKAQVSTKADLDAAWNLAHGSDLFNAANGVYVFRWKAYPMTRERLAEHLDQGIITSVREASGHLAAWCIVDNDPNWEGIEVTSLFGTQDGIAKLACAMRAQASSLGKAMVEVMMPLYPPALEALETAGYHIEMDPRHPEEVREHGVDIFELWLNHAA
jgi:GNAT superfamily N-acetyltransferase